MGIKTRVTSKGVVSTKITGDGDFGVEPKVFNQGIFSMVNHTGSVNITATGSFYHILSGTHPSMTATLPAISTSNIGKEILFVSEPRSANLLVSGTNSIVGTVHTFTVSGSANITTCAKFLALSGTNGYRWAVTTLITGSAY